MFSAPFLFLQVVSSFYSGFPKQPHISTHDPADRTPKERSPQAASLDGSNLNMFPNMFPNSFQPKPSSEWDIPVLLQVIAAGIGGTGPRTLTKAVTRGALKTSMAVPELPWKPQKFTEELIQNCRPDSNESSGIVGLNPAVPFDPTFNMFD